MRRQDLVVSGVQAKPSVELPMLLLNAVALIVTSYMERNRGVEHSNRLHSHMPLSGVSLMMTNGRSSAGKLLYWTQTRNQITLIRPYRIQL